jgi:cell division protein FtsI (penicillin-binding protein 3)
VARSVARIGALQFILGLALAAVVIRAAQVQVVQGGRYAAIAERQRTSTEQVPARRGTIYDRNGQPLVVTQEKYAIGIAPNEVTDPRATARLVAKHLGITARPLEQSLRDSKRYRWLAGPYPATRVEPLRDARGVHLHRRLERTYPSGDLAAPILGRLNAEGAGATGLELLLDSLLQGQPGEAVVLKDHLGRRYESPSRRRRAPVAGDDVSLTLDAELQDIAERGLEDAIAAADAEGGDVVLLHPETGEVLALASRVTVNGRLVSSPAAIHTTFEPGSTAKIFTAAALLVRGLVDSTDTENVVDGRWRMPIVDQPTRPSQYRTIEDSHRELGAHPMTLADAIRVSSNVAMAKFATRLTPEEQYETLRGFGFGNRTGIEFPSESEGRLVPPHQWTLRMTPASLAMGYELAVTPLQLAVAYAAIANDGIVLSPAIVKEIRDAEGEVIYRHVPEPVRRAVSPTVAATLREFLRGAVERGGTGERAQLGKYLLVGKTGTARRFRDGRYVSEYTGSFAALFPQDKPELVVVVKIDNPRTGSYYGAQTAAPATRDMLNHALAAGLLPLTPAEPTGRRRPRQRRDAPEAEGRISPPPVIIPWPPSAVDSAAPPPRPVPKVVALPIREAVLALHQRGFRVQLRGLGIVERTWPAAGAVVPRGRTVTVWAR